MPSLFRPLAAAALLCVAALRPSLAADSFTPAQRAEIIAIVRNAMKTDPSILRDAITAFQADETARQAAEARTAIVARKADLLNNSADAIAGNPAGDVTVVEFYDPRCPYCRRVLPDLEAMLRRDHGVRLVYKDIPVLGPLSVMESRAIIAAQKQGGYLKMQQALMKNPAQPDEAMIRATAKAQGLDPDRLVADMQSAETTKRIDANLDLARALKVDGTPAFVVGDRMIPGMVDANQLEDAISAARKHAS